MEHKIEVRQQYDESYKRMVIEEYLSSRCSKMELLRKYNIHFKSAINTWMKRLGNEDAHRSQKLKFNETLPLTVSIGTTSQNTRELQRRIQELEQHLPPPQCHPF
jgi:transposase-like protein